MSKAATDKPSPMARETSISVSLPRRVSNAGAEALAAYAMSAPATILLFLLLLGPASAVFVIALSDWQFGAENLSFVGLGNFHSLLEDQVFGHSLRNTLVFAAVVVPTSVFLGLGVAMLCSSRAECL